MSVTLTFELDTEHLALLPFSIDHNKIFNKNSDKGLCTELAKSVAIL